MRRALLATALLLWTLPGRAEGPACQQQDAALTCAKPPSLFRNICAINPFDLPDDPFSFSDGKVEACYRRLQNCAKAFLGGDGARLFVDNLKANIRLVQSEARTVSGIARYAGTRGSRAERIRFDTNADLTKLAAPLIFGKASTSLKGSVDDTKAKRELSWYVGDVSRLQSREHGFRRGALSFEDSREKKAEEPRREELAVQWAMMFGAIQGCEDVHDAALGITGLTGVSVSSTLAPAAGKQINKKISETLMCTLRAAGENKDFAMREKWPGCPCDPDEKGNNRGRILFPSDVQWTHESGVGTCVTTKTPDLFADQPIDDRVPDGIGRFLIDLKERLKPLVPVEVGLLGCTFPRFETGGNVKSLDKSKNPVLGTHHLSDHSEGTACDLRYVKFRSGCEIFTFNMQDGSKQPYFSELKSYFEKNYTVNGKPASWNKDYKLALKRGIGKFYSDLEADARPKPGPDGSVPAETLRTLNSKGGLQLWLGAAIRNSLVSSGFVPYDPMVNAAHHDHIHFELPRNGDDWRKMIADGTSPDLKESIIDPRLRCAGLGDCP